MDENTWSRDDSSAPVMATAAPLARNAGMSRYSSLALPDRIDPQPTDGPKQFHIPQSGALTPEASRNFHIKAGAEQITVGLTATPLDVNTRMARAEQDRRTEPSAADLVRADLQASRPERASRSSLRQEIQEAGNVYHGGQRASPGRVAGQLARHYAQSYVLNEIFNRETKLETHDVQVNVGIRPEHAPQAAASAKPDWRIDGSIGPNSGRVQFRLTF